MFAVGTDPDPQHLHQRPGSSEPIFGCWWDRRLDRCFALFSFHHLPRRRGVRSDERVCRTCPYACSGAPFRRCCQPRSWRGVRGGPRRSESAVRLPRRRRRHVARPPGSLGITLDGTAHLTVGLPYSGEDGSAVGAVSIVGDLATMTQQRLFKSWRVPPLRPLHTAGRRRAPHTRALQPNPTVRLALLSHEWSAQQQLCQPADYWGVTYPIRREQAFTWRVT